MSFYPCWLVGLALKREDIQLMQGYMRMGYTSTVRKDDTTHFQLFLVNTHAMDCILFVDDITWSSLDCATGRQVGHVGDKPGKLEFFDK